MQRIGETRNDEVGLKLDVERSRESFVRIAFWRSRDLLVQKEVFEQWN